MDSVSEKINSDDIGNISDEEYEEAMELKLEEDDDDMDDMEEEGNEDDDDDEVDDDEDDELQLHLDDEDETEAESHIEYSNEKKSMDGFLDEMLQEDDILQEVKRRRLDFDSPEDFENSSSSPSNEEDSGEDPSSTPEDQEPNLQQEQGGEVVEDVENKLKIDDPGFFEETPQEFIKKLPPKRTIPPIRGDILRTKQCKDESFINKFNDSNSLRKAAFQSRIPFSELSEMESVCFNDDNQPERVIQIRNSILKQWLSNPQEYLNVKDCIEDLDVFPMPGFDHIERIHSFLDRHGLINFGVCSKPETITQQNLKVIIIGAGISGLIAARKLRSFGADVTIIEGRDRIGGRVATYKKDSFEVDLGASIFAGLGGNPFSALIDQIDMKVSELSQNYPLYQSNGEAISPTTDDMVAKEFNKIANYSAYAATYLESKDKFSLGDVIDSTISLQEKHVREKRIENYKKVIDEQNKLKKCEILLDRVVKIIKNLSIKHKDMTKNNKDTSMEFKFRKLKHDLKRAFLKFDELDEAKNKILFTLEEMDKNAPPEVYLSPIDKQVINWHFANLEFANSAPLNNLSVDNLHNENGVEFVGPYVTPINGFSSLVSSLASDLNIELNTTVEKVHYNSNGCEIEVRNVNGITENHKADVILSTLPLGVLKESILGKSVEFKPALPEWKTKSIERFGYGNLNKVALHFEKAFWDDHNVFGHIGGSNSSRGELFLFYALPNESTMVGLISGNASNAMEDTSDDVLIARAVNIIKNIFGPINVPTPKDTLVTRWNSDPWSKGSFSYKSKNSSDEDLDNLACPLTPENTDTNPRIFFAGEHTSKEYYGTIHGALLSGLREAGRIADLYLGCPYIPDNSKLDVNNLYKLTTSC